MGRKLKEETMQTILETPEIDEAANELLAAIHEESKKEEEENLADIIVRPDNTSPDWSDFLLGELTDVECMVKYDKKNNEIGRYPKVNGLRRLAKMYVGDIIESYPTPIQINYSIDSGFIACAYQYTVIFSLSTGGTLKYSDVGEILNTKGNPDFSNIDSKYGRFPSSVAVTRAEARALRKALGLNVIAAEEFDSTKEAEPTDSQPLFIKDIQKTMMKTFCKRLKIDLNRYINTGPYAYDSLDKISFTHASNMVRQLESFQRPEGKLKDYDAQYHVINNTSL